MFIKKNKKTEQHIRNVFTFNYTLHYDKLKCSINWIEYRNKTDEYHLYISYIQKDANGDFKHDILFNVYEEAQKFANKIIYDTFKIQL